MSKKIRAKIVEFAAWAQPNWLAVIIIATIINLLMMFLILLSWFVGYWCNGLIGTKFELNSIWSGITVLGGTSATIFGLAKASWTKYKTDSEFNSEAGIEPTLLYDRHLSNDPNLSKETCNTNKTNKYHP